jgi:thiol-disulfide isomerase/thioredoxin
MLERPSTHGLNKKADFRLYGRFWRNTPSAETIAVALLLQIPLFWLGCSPSKSSNAHTVTKAPLKGVRDLQGHAIDPTSNITNRAVVLIFLSTECPICNRYAPEIQRLALTFRAKGIEFFTVYPNEEDTPARVAQHVRDYAYTTIPLLDPAHQLVRHTQATVTPEAIVLTTGGPIVYKGRIDDRFPRLGVEKPEPTQLDLRDALNQIVETRPVSNHGAPAVGCYIPTK